MGVITGHYCGPLYQCLIAGRYSRTLLRSVIAGCYCRMLLYVVIARLLSSADLRTIIQFCIIIDVPLKRLSVL